MSYYNLTNVTGADGMPELFTATNIMSGGWLGVCILITFAVIVFITLKDYPLKESFGATMFITSVVCIILRIMGLVSDFVTFIVIILTGVALITLFFKDN